MADLSGFIIRAALQSLIGRERDGRIYRNGAGNLWIRRHLGAKFSQRRVRNLMWRLCRAGLVEPGVRTAAAAVVIWCSTPAGLSFLEGKGRARG